MTEIQVRIQRFNPDVDQQPRLETFTVEVTPETTILDALEEIKAEQDGSLTFRRSCRHAICGSCAMNINNKNTLVCNSPIMQYAGRQGQLTIRPLPSLPVVKDLVVDRTRFWDQYLRVKPWLIPPEDTPEKEYRMTPDEVAALHDAEKCIMCGACFAACPIAALNPNYIGPHALQKQYMRVADPRDTATAERLDEVESQAGIYGCRTVGSCIDDCPKGLNPTQTISTLRNIALRRQQYEQERIERQNQLVD
ncbi:MAG: succinate dehydrogenase/fumarate reductase iron-sulfur subunit [Anaerolineae bacterium]